ALRDHHRTGGQEGPRKHAHPNRGGMSARAASSSQAGAELQHPRPCPRTHLLLLTPPPLAHPRPDPPLAAASPGRCPPPPGLRPVGLRHHARARPRPRPPEGGGVRNPPHSHRDQGPCLAEGSGVPPPERPQFPIPAAGRTAEWGGSLPLLAAGRG